MAATIYGIPGCPHTLVAALMLERKEIAYRRIDLPPGPHPFLVRHALRFQSDTVPALRLDGTKLQETRSISRHLDLIPPASESVEAELELALRPLKRDLLWWAVCERPEAAASFLPYPLPASLQRLIARVRPPDEAAARQAAADVPASLEKVDLLLADGLIGGDPTSVDLHAAVLVRLISCFEDFRPQLAGRPAATLADRLCPPGRYPGFVPSVL